MPATYPSHDGPTFRLRDGRLTCSMRARVFAEKVLCSIKIYLEGPVWFSVYQKRKFYIYPVILMCILEYAISHHRGRRTTNHDTRGYVRMRSDRPATDSARVPSRTRSLVGNHDAATSRILLGTTRNDLHARDSQDRAAHQGAASGCCRHSSLFESPRGFAGLFEDLLHDRTNCAYSSARAALATAEGGDAKT